MCIRDRDTAGKYLERLLKPRLLAAIQSAGELSNRQYGFRKGRSTLRAVGEIVRTFHAARQGNFYSRNIVLLATLDIKNAFTSVSWNDMFKALEHFFWITQYLLQIRECYLSDKKFIYDMTDFLVGRSSSPGLPRAQFWALTFGTYRTMEFYGRRHRQTLSSSIHHAQRLSLIHI